MLKNLTTVLLLLFCNVSIAQNFLNGDFENNSGNNCQMNISNATFNSNMFNTTAFGLGNEVDIHYNNCGYGLPYSGNWFVSIATSVVGTPDALSMTLASPLIAGNSYQFLYSEWANVQFTVTLDSIEIGLSNSPTTFGTLIYTSLPVVNTWTQRTVSFVAPINGSYLTIKNKGTSRGWNYIDGFTTCTAIPNLGNDTAICQGQSITLNGGTATSYLWSNGATTSTINITTPGTYWVQTGNAICSASDSITIAVNQYPAPNLGNDTSFCQGQTISLNGGSAGTYLWSNGATTASIIASTSATYWVQASNGICSTTDSVLITVNPSPIPNLGNDTTLCQGQSITLTGSNTTSYLWSNGSTASAITTITPGIYWVQESNGLCTAVDSVTISVNQYPTPNLGNDTTLCQGQSFSLNGGTANSYLWSNNSTASSITASTSGIYWVQASNGLCSGVDSVTISVIQYPLVNLGVDTTYCQGQSIILTAGTASNYFWSNGSTTSSINVNTSGTYWVQAGNGLCITTDSVLININQNPVPNLVNDTTLCQGQMISLNAGSATSYLWSNNSTASSINANNAGIYWVQASNGICSAIDSIIIAINQYPAPNLGNDTTLCQGQTITFNGGAASTYLWSDNSTTSSINALSTGIYWVQASNGWCSATDSVLLTINQIPAPNLGNDTTLCSDQSITLVGSSATSYLWSNGSTTSSINTNTPGIYWVQESNGLCVAYDSITISMNQYPVPDLGNDTTFCQGQTLTLIGSSANTYLWSDGSSGAALTVGSSGIYWVQESNGVCSTTDSITINIEQFPVAYLGADTTLCQGQTLVLNGGTATNYLWSDGTNASSISVTTSGSYWVQLATYCGTNTDTLSITFEDCHCTPFIANAFSPNNDDINDHFAPVIDCDFLAYHFMIFNRWGQKLYDTTNPADSWDGTSNGAVVPGGVYAYIVTYKFAQEIQYSGYVHLFR